jgi:hypothetical protein
LRWSPKLGTLFHSGSLTNSTNFVKFSDDTLVWNSAACFSGSCFWVWRGSSAPRIKIKTLFSYFTRGIGSVWAWGNPARFRTNRKWICHIEIDTSRKYSLVPELGLNTQCFISGGYFEQKHLVHAICK